MLAMRSDEMKLDGAFTLSYGEIGHQPNLEAVGLVQNWRRHDSIGYVHGSDKSDDNDGR
jgi:hypothetical protein